MILLTTSPWHQLFEVVNILGLLASTHRLILLTQIL